MHANLPPQSEGNALGKTLLITLGAVALIGALSCFGCFSWLMTGPEGGVRMANDMEPYAVEYIKQHDLVEDDESIISYYDETIALDGTEAIILTNRRVVHHVPTNTTDVALADIEDINVTDAELGTTIVMVRGADGSRMKLEFAAFNDGELFIEALRDQHQRVVGGK